MNRKRDAGRVLAALVALATVVPVSGQAARLGRIEMNQHFPLVHLPALDDAKPRDLREYRGKRIVLHVFASW